MMEVDSMNKIKMNIWGRDFDLPVMIKQFKGKEITDIQKDAVEKFTSCEKVVNEAKNDVEKYVIKNGLKDMGMDSVGNIFKYVIPKTISVPKAKKRVVAIMCNFKFDMEHGMAIVFEDEKIKKIGPQDIVL